MRRRPDLTLAVIFIVTAGSVSLTPAKGFPGPQGIPRSANVEVRLLKAPGLNLAGSKWEVAYEFRIIAESNLFAERKKLNEGSTEHAGDLIKKATLASSLMSPNSQRLTLQIPFTSTTLDRLKHQPADRLAPGEDRNSQVFLFYAVITVHDAKLRKTLTIPVTRTWDFANFPDARFGVSVEIDSDGSYSVRSSSRKTPTITTERRVQ